MPRAVKMPVKAEKMPEIEDSEKAEEMSEIENSENAEEMCEIEDSEKAEKVPEIEDSDKAEKLPQIEYSQKYFDDYDIYEYRHVTLPPHVQKLIPRDGILTEIEWRAIGICQSRGWEHYAIHPPEPHILLFRRPLNYQQIHEQEARQN